METILSIAYKEVGTITMDREQEAKEEEDNGFFPIMEIKNSLK